MEETAAEKTMKEVEENMKPVKEEKPKEQISYKQVLGIAVILAIVLGTAIGLSQYFTAITVSKAVKEAVKAEMVPFVKQQIQKPSLEPSKLDAKDVLIATLIRTEVTKAVDEAFTKNIKQKVIETPFHIVAKDETLWGISKYYKIDLKSLEKANEDILKTTNGIIYPGMGLRLP